MVYVKVIVCYPFQNTLCIIYMIQIIHNNSEIDFISLIFIVSKIHYLRQYEEYCI